MKNPPRLSERLLAVSGYVRDGAFVADVGTDHAYLPIYLCAQNKISGAIASDINEGPIDRARINVSEYGLCEKISLCLTDGLSGIESYSPSDIMICGMGGELIVKILSEADWVKRDGIRLILQPMTHADKLRKYLCEVGFLIIDESIVKEDRSYQIICAEYTGERYSYTDVELILGKHNIEKMNQTFIEYANYVRGVFLTKRDGKLSSGADVSDEENIINEIDLILKNKK